jgi:CubicO group peptidase (beta-lactamase class C family)
VDHNKAPHFQKITLKHLLRMQSGIEWHEHDRPLDETNTTFQLENSSDWIQFTLDQPMDAEPGTKWVYNSGGSHLMSGIIKKATGKFIDEYAEEFLFKPLGIKTYHWKKTPKGFPDTEGGLFLRAEDLAKIGQLYLNDGIWEGKQLLPGDWVAEATAIQVENVFPNGWGYGYQWWRCDYKNTAVWTGLGFGDQMLCVLPEYHIIGVVNSWNVFGAQNKNIMGDFIKALVNSNH